MTKKDYERLAKALKTDMIKLKFKPYSELTDWEKELMTNGTLLC